MQWLRHGSYQILMFVRALKNRPLDLNQDAKLGVPQCKQSAVSCGVQSASETRVVKLLVLKVR